MQLRARRFFLLALALGLLPASGATAQTTTQSFTLVPGWNSIHVEVDPANPAPAAVFGSLPIEQVWSYFPTVSPVEYIASPADGLWNVAGWNVWLPPSQPDAQLTNLFAIQGGRSFLIKLTGTANATLTVTGRPSYRTIKWKPDSFTLTGLPVDPAVTVRAGDFFASSSAHAGQLRYRLDPTGTWFPLADTATLRAGVAYWILTKGPSNFTAPLQLDLGGTTLLDYGDDSDRRPLKVINNGTLAATVSLANPSSLPLVLGANDASGNLVWTPLTSTTFEVAAGQTATLDVGLRRATLPATLSGLLTVSAQGVRYAVAVAARNPNAAVGNPHTGLWLGTVTLGQVSESNSATPSNVTATPAEFTMRVILHVDATGTTRLLKDVTVMRQRNPVVVNGAPALVLVTDPARIPDFKGTAIREGAPFSARVSSVGFDFAGLEVPLTGAFSSVLSGNVVIPRDSATHPFKHRYHPDHDDLDANYQALPVSGLTADKEEVWPIQRALVFTFDPVNPGDQSPASGYTRRNGTYQETVTGMHKNPLITRGVFVLQRLNNLAVLNPPVQPAP